MTRRFPLAAAALALALSAPVAAQMATPACSKVSDANLPADLGAWRESAVPLDAGLSATGRVPELATGVPVAIRLHAAQAVTLRLPPGQTRSPDSPHAGLLDVVIRTRGVWRFSASTGLWVDLVGPSGLVQSTAFGALAPCTSIRKVVEFPLEPGRYTVQLSGNAGPDTRVMLTLKP